MNWKDLGKHVKKFAPILGTVLGGPAGAAAGGAVSLLCAALGIQDPEPKPEQIYSAIQADPQAAVKMREIELNNKVELEKLALQSDQAHLADRQSARTREIEITKTTGKRDINLYILAWTVIIGFFMLCGILMKWDIPEGSGNVVYLLFGGLVAGFTQVLGYFFGSSKSSSEKTNLLALKK